MRPYLSAPNLIAAAFCVVFLGLALAIADWPPPPSFVELVPYALALSLLTRARVPAYAAWARAQRPHRVWRVLAEGALAGLLLGLLLMLPVGPGEPNVPDPGLTEYLIWFAVLGLCGAIAAGLVYALAAWCARHGRGL
ncbi:MAG: hypothetical protein REI09_04860 [Candidatus Dactylopiibacterium sp.]|nr:hypothetical protein [Candidatus Dactylopiibacterium sp.]